MRLKRAFKVLSSVGDRGVAGQLYSPAHLSNPSADAKLPSSGIDVPKARGREFQPERIDLESDMERRQEMAMEFNNSVAAKWNGIELARSDDTVIVEGNHYFPKESVNPDYLVDSDHSSRCFWKGTAAYFDVVVDDETNPDAAFYYPEPKKKASMITDRIAFRKGVEVS
jgi:uncharacterized protein (DUF427 family)